MFCWERISQVLLFGLRHFVRCSDDVNSLRDLLYRPLQASLVE